MIKLKWVMDSAPVAVTVMNCREAR